MSWKQKRIEDLNTRLLDKVELLGEYEKKSDFEDEPTEKKKLRGAIQRLKEEINRISIEIEEIQNPQTSEELSKISSRIDPDLIKIRQQHYDEYIKRKRKEKD